MKKSIFRCFTMDKNVLCFYEFTCILVMCWMKLLMCWKIDNHNILNTNQDIINSCLLNTMCRCFPNETDLQQISCNELNLYKLPEFLHGTVKHLELRHTMLQYVDDETFQGFRLESLKLINNKLFELSERSFSHMSHSLMLLDISGNLFQAVPLKALNSIQTLSRIVAQRNFIQQLDGDWGLLVNSLRMLNLAENSISEICKNCDESKQQQRYQHNNNFARLKRLVWLDLSSNNLQHIKPDYLPKSIMTINLSKNFLTAIPKSILTQLNDLRILHLKDNLLKTLGDISFRDLRSNIEKIDFSQNRIYALPSSSPLFNESTRIKALNFDQNFISSIPSHAFIQTSIVHLVMSNNFINHIDDDAFATLEHTLEYLDFDRNFLRHIPNAIYSLKNLRYLYLSTNEISFVDSLPSTLKVLSLNTNNFTLIPIEALANCPELSYLNMGNNQISEIEPSTFVRWGRELQTLLLRNNKIESLSHDALIGLDSIKEISLSFNNIHHIDSLTFENISRTLQILELSFGISNDDDLQMDDTISSLNELIWLSLDNNNLKSISNYSLTSLARLTFINLSFNRLISIPKKAFHADSHRDLLEIDLSFNLIEKIRSKTFGNLESLQIINLSENKIRCTEHAAFFNLRSLYEIDLSFNELRNLSENLFEHLPNLLKLDVTFNKLVTFSLKCFKHVSNASTPMSINISNNAIHHFDGELSTYLYIYSLDVSNNHLVDTQSFRNIGYSLRVLYLNGNRIGSLSNHALGDLPALEILNLAHNNLTTLGRRTFQGLTNLQELDLSHNAIEGLQVEQFSKLLRLRYLRLNNNRIKALSRNIFLNTRIEFLDLSHNMLALWPINIFSDIGFTLNVVHINNNLLEYLDATMFMNTQYLVELNLSGNQIKVLPDNTFSTLINLTSLDLSLNPLVTANFKELLFNTQHLRFLSLKSIGLTTVPTMHLSELMELDLSNNHIKELDVHFRNLRNLRKFIVSGNKFSNLTALARNVPSSVRHLELSRNPLRKMTAYDFEPIKHLEHLEMEDVTILSAETYANLSELKVFRATLEHNLAEIVSQLHGLRELYVTAKEHRLTEKYFGKELPNSKLNYIEITGYRLKSLAPYAFHGLASNTNLKISIRNTMIKSLPPNLYTLYDIPKLSVDLSNNKMLMRVASDVFYTNSSMWNKHGSRKFFDGISLGTQNAITCDCEHVWYAYWMRRWLKERIQSDAISKETHKIMLKEARHNTCIDPISGKKVPFLTLYSEDLLCYASALNSFGVKVKLDFSNFFLLFTITLFVIF